MSLITSELVGGIPFVTGPLISGKSLVAINVSRHLQEQGLLVAVGQPAVERPDVVMGDLRSRLGGRLPAIPIHSATQIRELFAEACVVVVDEVQFLPSHLQDILQRELTGFPGCGLITGLEYTSLRTVFPICAWLKQRATAVFRLSATCVVCGCPTARYSQRLIDGRPTASNTPLLLLPSAEVRYEPRCEVCHQI